MTLDIRYIAGLIDGEGCVTIHLRLQKSTISPHGYSVQVSIAQKRPKVLRMIRSLFGGHLAPPRKKCKVYILTYTHRKAEAILKAVLPYLIVKKREAEIALELRELVKIGTYGSGWGGNIIPGRTRRRMFTLWKELMTLPGRGNRLGKRSRQILGRSIA
jgi:hypothetical protein